MRSTASKICDGRPRLPSCRDLVFSMWEPMTGGGARGAKPGGSRRLYRRPVNLRQLLRSYQTRLGEGLITRDKELFQTPVFSSRHRRGWMRGRNGRRGGGAPNKDVNGFVFFNIYLVGFFVFFLQVGEGASKVTAAQQVPPDRWQRGGRRSSRQKKRTHMDGIN